MTEKRTETVGKICHDLMLKDPVSTDPIELERAMQEDYINQLKEAVEVNRKLIHGDFYVVVTTKMEPLMVNAFRNFFEPRHTCPTPQYDQSVYKYFAKEEHLAYMWTVPCKDACIYLKRNAQYVVKEEQQILHFALAFLDGSLDKLAKQLNGEREDSILIDSTLKGA